MDPNQGLSCSVCNATPHLGLKAVIAPCGSTVCQDCTLSSQTSHCEKCSDQKFSAQTSQKTMVLHNFFTHFHTTTVSLPSVGLGLTNPFGVCDRAARENFDCPICFDLIFDPVTVNCGHSFCRPCLARAIDHSPACPVCRGPLPQYSTQLSRPTDLLIQQLTKLLFPDDFQQKQAHELKAIQELENELPIFVCVWAFPKLSCFLHVFEPRYRLMMRRAMEGQRVFGMVSQTASEAASPYGTLLRIEELQMLPDGRSVVQTIGVRKFQILTKGEKDGYMTGKVAWIDDDAFDPTLEENEKLRNVALTASQSFLESIPTLPRYQLVGRYGSPPEDIPTLSYWMISVLESSLPDMFTETFYSTTDPVKRLQTATTLFNSITLSAQATRQ